MLYLTPNMKEAKDDFPEWDLIIVGAGPAGTAAALETLGKNYKVALMDKAVFPRDKICGDALSPDVVQQFSRIRPSLAERFAALESKQEINGLRTIAPNKRQLDIKLNAPEKQRGYVVSRIDLDALMMEEVKSHPEIQVFEATEIIAITYVGQFLRLETDKGFFTTRLLIGADGNHSIVAKLLGGRHSIDRRHHCAAMRQYYENVDWPEGRSFIELHFMDEILPGYLWVFPMANNRANVGIGMLSSDVSEKKVNLKKVLEKQLATHPELAPRFANARPLESAKGFGIPIGSRKYSLSGKNYLLAGDAARIVDPLSGEGIGNALRSGRFAGKQALAALEAKRYDADFLKAYDKKLYSMIGDELRMSRFLQKSFRRKGTLNFFLNLATTSNRFRNLIRVLFEESNFFTEWARLSYYKGLITKKRKH